MSIIPPCTSVTGILFGFLALEDGTDRFPETSERNYHYSLRNSPEEGSSHSTEFSPLPAVSCIILAQKSRSSPWPFSCTNERTTVIMHTYYNFSYDYYLLDV
jgi:hypothetical protein